MKKGQLWYIVRGTDVWYDYFDTHLYCAKSDEAVLILDYEFRGICKTSYAVQVLTHNGIVGWCSADMLRKL